VRFPLFRAIADSLPYINQFIHESYISWKIGKGGWEFSFRSSLMHRRCTEFRRASHTPQPPRIHWLSRKSSKKNKGIVGLWRVVRDSQSPLSHCESATCGACQQTRVYFHGDKALYFQADMQASTQNSFALFDSWLRSSLRLAPKGSRSFDYARPTSGLAALKMTP